MSAAEQPCGSMPAHWAMRQTTRQEVIIMVRKALFSLSLAALHGIASWSGTVQADDSEGIVRICDQVPGQAMNSTTPGGQGYGGAGCPNGVCQNGGHGGYGHGGYGHAGCRTGHGYHGLGGIYMGGLGCPGSGCRHTGHVHQFLDWFNPHGMCTHSPDHGWAPPGKLRTPHARPVAYQKSFPDAWTGQPGYGGGQRAVAVYMPTDTTQLGYYYQAVPQWHAYQGMIPPTPVPSQWHRPLCNGAGCQTCRNGGHGAHGQAQPGEVIHGEVHNGEVIQGEVQQGVPVQDREPELVDPAPPMAPIPVPEAPAPAPQPPLEKAERPDLQPIS